MPTRKHYFVEQRADGRYAVRGKGLKRASAILATPARGHRPRRRAQLRPITRTWSGCATPKPAIATSGGRNSYERRLTLVRRRRYGLMLGEPGSFFTLSEMIFVSCITAWLKSA